MSVVTVDEVKAALKKSLDTDNTKIQRMIDAAEAEYLEHVGPLAGTVTNERHNVYGSSFFLNAWGVTSVTSVTGYAGTVATTYTLAATPAAGGNATYLLDGSRLSLTTGAWCGAVWVTYEAELLKNHRETIIADVAGYFEVTQRSGGANPPAFPGAGYAEGAYGVSPLTLFPRIRALAPPRVG